MLRLKAPHLPLDFTGTDTLDNDVGLILIEFAHKIRTTSPDQQPCSALSISKCPAGPYNKIGNSKVPLKLTIQYINPLILS